MNSSVLQIAGGGGLQWGSVGGGGGGDVFDEQSLEGATGLGGQLHVEGEEDGHLEFAGQLATQVLVQRVQNVAHQVGTVHFAVSYHNNNHTHSQG